MKQTEALKVIKYPYITEKGSMLITNTNTLTFIVREDAGKEKVKEAVESLYNVKVEKVGVLTSKKGKKAYVRLAREYSASELASKIGIV
ncbi:MAG: 50S ribosomal protein L23 [Nitrososphaeria archaeon]